MGQSRQQSPPPAFLQHDCALSPRAAAQPAPPPPSASPLSFFSCLYFALSHCFLFIEAGGLGWGGGGASAKKELEFMRAAVCWRGICTPTVMDVLKSVGGGRGQIKCDNHAKTWSCYRSGWGWGWGAGGGGDVGLFHI